MAQAGKIYPDAEEFNRTPPPAGSYYNVKDQHLPAPATYQRGRRGRSGCCCLLSCLCTIFTIFVILSGIFALVFWLVVHPRAPKFDVENVQIDGLTSLSSPVNTNITFQIMARNPNKHMDIYYDSIDVNVETDGANVGSGNIPPFHQGHQNTTYLTGHLSSQNLTLSQDTVNFLTNDASNLPLYAKVDVRARVKVGSVKSSKIEVKVRCNLIVDLTRPSGSQLKSKACDVKW